MQILLLKSKYFPRIQVYIIEPENPVYQIREIDAKEANDRKLWQADFILPLSSLPYIKYSGKGESGCE